ncbi:hypothetical protein HYALB_00005054 [Hymenoscyphus albidus]|uniref:NAD(P)-binding domain-containing protein n=1 Tax=Hymenoscyphus albidus TaxID=595503 RepID=A0A9N9Q3M3_9HELO|nr:hypothetical protein HYALB_00005054 [Hymenoscyphus albidus]
MSDSKPQNVLVLGSTGPLGVLIVKELLLRDIQTTLFVRNPSKLPSDITQNPKITVIEGTLESAPTTLHATLSNYTTIISTLGPVGLQRSKETPITDFFTVLLHAISALPTKPRVFHSSTGSVTDPSDKFTFIMWLSVLVIKLLAPGARNEILSTAKVFVEHGNDIDWTLFRLGVLSDEKEGEVDANGEKKVAHAGYIADEKWQLMTPRSQIARWVVKQATEGKVEWNKKMPALAGI